MNHIEKPKGVKLWKKQKTQKQILEDTSRKVKIESGDEVKPKENIPNRKRKNGGKHKVNSKNPNAQTHDEPLENLNSEENTNGTVTKISESNEILKSILKKRKNESQDSNKKKRVKPNDLTRKQWKMLHLDKKDSLQHSKTKTDDANKTTDAIKRENMTKKEWKKLKMQKKGKGDNFEIGETLKTLWGDLRREDCKPEKKSQLLKQACDLLKGRVKEFTFAHDTVRVLECILAEGAETHRTQIFDELKNEILPLTKSKYGKFFVQKVLRYGTKQQKEEVMKTFHGKVVKLIRHAEAAEVVELAFNECANANQRFEFVQEFYDPAYKYFKTREVRTLGELFEKEPSKKETILKHMKEELLKVLDKTVVKHSIVHHVLWQFMAHADPTSKAEVIESVRDVVHEILHTKDGSRVGMNCVWYGSLKDRKVIIKSMKTFVAKIAMEEHGHMVLLALFDCFDDTVFLYKHIIRELSNHLLELSQNIHGKKVLIYLLSPRDPHFIHPDVINILKQGDGNVTSKKEPEVRRSELKAVIAGPLLNLINSNIQNLYTDNAFCLFTLTILQHTIGNREACFQSIADLVVEPYTTENKNTHPIEHSGSHFMFKQLIKRDKEESNDEVKFSEVLIQKVPQLVFKSWMECNRGAFLLVSLLESGLPSVVKRIKEELTECKKYLSRKPYKGAEILIKKLKE